MANPKPNEPSGSLGVIRGQIIQTAIGSIKAPENIVQTVTAARQMYESLRFQNMKRIELFAAIEGLIQGNPPYDQQELDQNGMNIANFNNMDGTARYEKSGLAFWNLLNASEYIAQFCFYDTKTPEFTDYAEILARHFNTVVREWRSFVRNFCCLTGQLLKFGYASLIWSDERDWRWRPIETTRLFLPDEASTDTSLLTTIFVEAPFTVQELYNIYQVCKDLPPDTSPWNTDVLASFLIYRANQWVKNPGTENAIINMMDLQTRLQNNDVCLGWLFQDEVRLVTLFQKEYSGKISHYIFDKYYTTPTGNDGFLYFVNEQYKDLEEAFALFTYSPDVFTVHSNRGVGHKLFAPCQATSQLDCDMFNMARFSSSPIIRTSALSTRDVGAITFRPGMPIDIGTAEFEQNQLGSNINGVVAASQYLLAKLSANITYAGDDPSVPDQVQGSLSDSQAKRKDYKEQGVQKNTIAHFYNQFDPVLYQMLVKMINSKKGDPGYEAFERWKELSILDGVPEELLATTKEGKPRFFYCRASRAGGDGSTLGLMIGMDTIAPIAQGFPAKGMRRYQEDYVRNAMGQDYVTRYLSEEQPDSVSEGASEAQLENVIMKFGESPLFSPDNPQRAHITVHFEFLKYIMQLRAQDQMDAVQVDKIFSVAVPHQGEHIQFIAKNPLQRVFFESIKEAWNQVQNYAQLNRKNAESQLKAQLKQKQQDQEKTQEVLTDQQRKDFVAKREQDRKDIESAHKMDRNEQQSNTRADIQEKGVELGAENQRRKIDLDAQNKQLEIESKPVEDRSVPELKQDLVDLQGVSPSLSDFK